MTTKKISITLKNSSGSILLEAFMAIMVISIAFGVLLDIGTLSVKTSTSIQKNSQANFLLKEEMEIIRTYRDGTTWSTNGLGTVGTGGNNFYYFALNNNMWNLTSGTETTGIFKRYVVFDKVSRDPTTQNIEAVYNSSHDDPDTRKATVTVSWPETTLHLVSYFSNWK